MGAQSFNHWTSKHACSGITVLVHIWCYICVLDGTRRVGLFEFMEVFDAGNCILWHVIS